MGTNVEVSQLQSEIKALAGKIGWTQNRLARILYTELHECDDDDAIRRFQERIKKELKRPTTSPEKLRKYLEIAVSHPEASKARVVFNKHVPLGAVSDSLRKGMSEISGELDRTTDETRSLRRR